jgi:hypothetical protein
MHELAFLNGHGWLLAKLHEFGNEDVQTYFALCVTESSKPAKLRGYAIHFTLRTEHHPTDPVLGPTRVS